MKKNTLSRKAAFAALLVLGLSGQAMAWEDFSLPPGGEEDDPGAVVDEHWVKDALARQMTSHYALAAGGVERLLTKKQAAAAAWGFVSDNFALIDKDGDGYIRLKDVMAFVESRSPQK